MAFRQFRLKCKFVSDTDNVFAGFFSIIIMNNLPWQIDIVFIHLRSWGYLPLTVVRHLACSYQTGFCKVTHPVFTSKWKRAVVGFEVKISVNEVLASSFIVTWIYSILRFNIILVINRHTVDTAVTEPNFPDSVCVQMVIIFWSSSMRSFRTESRWVYIHKIGNSLNPERASELLARTHWGLPSKCWANKWVVYRGWSAAIPNKCKETVIVLSLPKIFHWMPENQCLNQWTCSSSSQTIMKSESVTIK